VTEETHQQPPRTWVLWVVRVALALTVLHLSIGAISAIWLGKVTGTFWWLIMSLPQVSIALLAILICWDWKSRPEGLGITAGMLNMFGMLGALAFLKWLPMVIGILTILAMLVRPRDWIFSGTPPPRFPGLQSRWSRLVRR